MTSPPPPAEAAQWRPSYEVTRIPLTAMGIGFVSGCFSTASRASMVFMAENAHRQPETVQGWYFYNKTKNYKIILAAVKGGVGAALRLGTWAGSWVLLDQAVGYCRRSILFGPSAVAGSASDVSTPSNSGLPSIAPARQDRDQYMRAFDGAVAGMGIASAAILLHRLPRPTSYHFVLGGLIAGGSFGALRDLQSWIAEKKARDETA
ncbi:hypothetical protein V8E36_002930 [Tilletia maclaganii]